MSRRRIKKGRITQRDYQKYSNHRLMRSIYDQNQKKIKSRLYKKPEKKSVLDTLREYQYTRALLFAHPKARVKRVLRPQIAKIKTLNLTPVRDIICTSRKIRKYIMFAKGQVGHGTSKRRRKMTLTSKVRC